MTETKDPNSPLLSASREAYGDRYDDHLFDQYKLFVESAQKVTEWRNATNNYFITVNSALAALYGILASSTVLSFWRYAIPLAGLLVCAAWRVLIASYRDLNSAKFEVIHELEAKLPVALFKHEWSHLQRTRKGGKYRPLSHVEGWIPVAFALLHVVLAGAVFFGIPTERPRDKKAANAVIAAPQENVGTKPTEPPSVKPSTSNIERPDSLPSKP